MAIFKCKMCGGDLNIEDGISITECEYCGTKQTLPRLNDDRKANFFNRANHLRINNEFDKAMGIYEQILNEDNTDAEIYWSLVLCRFGIEYVEDPVSHNRVPTVNRAQFTSIFDDLNYKSALQYADEYQKAVYEAEANAINELQKEILAISQKEEPFDVFICYKESDNNGRRTKDSVIATELYHELSREGYKVFFSRITLEDKLGTAYEPYIFAALNSSKIMVVIGTKREHFNAVWVKNEWSRYLSLIRNGAKKILIPAYRDMDPYDLPEEFSHLQAQDMSKLGFMQDLIRGINKLAKPEEAKPVINTATASDSNGNLATLIKRGQLALEYGEWNNADSFFEQALNINAENADAYLGKLLSELKISKIDELKNCEDSFENSNTYKKLIRFADSSLAEILKGAIASIAERKYKDEMNQIYNEALGKKQSAETEEEFKLAAEIFAKISDWQDSAMLAEECVAESKRLKEQEFDEIYRQAVTEKEKAVTQYGYQTAADLFGKILDWKDSEKLQKECFDKIDEYKLKVDNMIRRKDRIQKILLIVAIVSVLSFAGYLIFSFIQSGIEKTENEYKNAVLLMEDGNYIDAIKVFEKLGTYKDSADKISLCEKLKKEEFLALIEDKNRISVSDLHVVGLNSDGTVVATGSNEFAQCDVSDWTDIIALDAVGNNTVGLKSNGTVVVAGHLSYADEVSAWTDIVAVSSGGSHMVGLKSDGTVVAAGDNYYWQCEVSDWTDIIAVSAGWNHTVGLKSDGTVVAVGDSQSNGQCAVSDWTDIVAISACHNQTFGLRADDTVVAVGFDYSGQCEVSDWTDVVSVSAGWLHTVGLKSDGTVVATGANEDGQCEVSDWTDIIAVSAGTYHTVGLKSDGTVVVAGGERLFIDNQDDNISTPITEWDLID